MPVNEPTRPSGISALATTSGARVRAATSGAAQSDAVRDEFAAADARAIVRANDRLQGIAPEAYGDDDGAPIGPSEEEEAAFLAEDSSSHFSGGTSESSTRSLGTRLSARVEAEVISGPLPSLDELRERISPEILGLMDELFRAKLTRVVRVSERDLKK
ncbi:hypothetical protein AXK12_03490 [Cephaloticoccus capnophilus]|uniref:Uncharacterized protein n=1 Tax=Cephaloticoccus capnophilus TaxID=1548208 RepID=A0A139SP49_9BACT|nr:hypothetical protein [Cephaloticoccus capnophilus]KXU36358.1 hypothetical protein AXK12_03490 [Cephaloticoccus capnophilus]